MARKRAVGTKFLQFFFGCPLTHKQVINTVILDVPNIRAIVKNKIKQEKGRRLSTTAPPTKKNILIFNQRWEHRLGICYTSTVATVLLDVQLSKIKQEKGRRLSTTAPPTKNNILIFNQRCEHLLGICCASTVATVLLDVPNIRAIVKNKTRKGSSFIGPVYRQTF